MSSRRNRGLAPKGGASDTPAPKAKRNRESKASKKYTSGGKQFGYAYRINGPRSAVKRYQADQ